MLPKSNAEKLVADSLLRAEPIHDTARQAAAALCLSYHDGDEDGTAMSADLTAHYGALLYAKNPTGLMKWNERPKVCFNLLRPIASALCSLYDDPVRYTFAEDEGYWAELFESIREEHLAAMNDADLYTWLGGTAGVRPLVTEKNGPVRFALYTGDQLEATPDPLEKSDPAQLVISWQEGAAGARNTKKHFWTKNLFRATVDDTELLDEWEEAAYPGGVHPYGRIPVQLFHNRRPRWSCFDLAPMDLLNVNRAINKKATDLDWRMTLAGDVLFTKNYTQTSPPVVGAGGWIELGVDGSGEFGGPDPRVDEAVETINLYLKMALMSRRIPENAIMAQQTGESGIKVVADSAALSGFRRQRAAIFQPQERELIRLELMIAALHSGKRVTYEQVPAPSIAYTMPQQAMSVERMADWDRRIRLNMATPVDELMELEPSLTREEAEERIAENAKYNGARNARPVIDRGELMDEDDGE